MDSAPAVIKAVTTTLTGNVTLNGLIAGRIYTDVPQKATFPYLVLNLDSGPFAASDFSGQSHTLRLQIFSQDTSAKEALNIRKACLDALDRQESAVTVTGFTLVRCEYSGNGTMFKEDDGKTWQAIGELELVVV